MSICTETLKDLDMHINDKKCQCIRIGPRYDLDCAHILINNTPVQWVQEMKILGVKIKISKLFDCARNERKSKFYRCVNSILGRMPISGDSSSLLTLIDTKVVPVLINSIDCIGISAVELRTMSHAYYSVYAKKFNSWNQDIIALCQYYSGRLPFEYLCAIRRFNFLKKLKT